MATHEFSEVITDQNYRPLPVECADLEAEARDLAYRIMRCRESGHFALASAYEAKFAKVYMASWGTSRETIAGERAKLQQDMARRLRDSKPKLTLIDNTELDASLALLARVGK